MFPGNNDCRLIWPLRCGLMALSKKIKDLLQSTKPTAMLAAYWLGQLLFARDKAESKTRQVLKQ